MLWLLFSGSGEIKQKEENQPRPFAPWFVWRMYDLSRLIPHGEGWRMRTKKLTTLEAISNLALLFSFVSPSSILFLFFVCYSLSVVVALSAGNKGTDFIRPTRQSMQQRPSGKLKWDPVWLYIRSGSLHHNTATTRTRQKCPDGSKCLSKLMSFITCHLYINGKIRGLSHHMYIWNKSCQCAFGGPQFRGTRWPCIDWRVIQMKCILF